jgi:hypothetical protein
MSWLARPSCFIFYIHHSSPASSCFTTPIYLHGLNHGVDFFFLLLWAALTAGCYYPFNDNRLLNETLRAKYIANAIKGGDGWVTVINEAGLKTAWPRASQDQPILIPYCYESWADENVLGNRCTSIYLLSLTI